ncbi:MAG TPA: NeuD/PglB/VioB family sugar acetyltransferase [Cyclobacteriaceae bacterium]|jgi:sugar O-acyltransferase (sialic acid O-acetyltransferase NeuD family)|nr:NeuD/PglB/VioB family sugar acetyltransferase [Cyclobacteriaceae bacterium]
MKNPVIIFGANYIGRAAKEIFEKNEAVVYGFLDDDKKLHNKEIDEASVLGATDDDGFLKLIGKKCEAFIALDDNKLRKNLTKMLNDVRHVQPVNAVHPQALVSAKAEIGYGNFIDGGAQVAVAAKVGSHCMVHTNAVVGVQAVLGNFVQVGAGSIIGAGVHVEDEVFIGAGVTIVAGITIGKGARVGAGSVVIAPVKAGETVFGNPAAPIKG